MVNFVPKARIWEQNMGLQAQNQSLCEQFISLLANCRMG
jgi:hypothetical protein